MIVFLSDEEVAALFIQYPYDKDDGVFHSFLFHLQNKVNRYSGEIDLSSEDLERIPRYAFDYGKVRWEARMLAIFRRVLGPELGR